MASLESSRKSPESSIIGLMDCVFCKIVKGEIPSFRVAENDEFLAFLSIAPIKKGHTLVIPKKHSEYIFEMGDEALGQLMAFAKPVAEKLKTKIEPKTGKIGIMVAGLEVPHTHLHLIPMDVEGDLDFANAAAESPEDLKSILERING